MRTDIKHKKYRMIYKQVQDMYCNEFLNITQCCKELAITPSTYQRICNELNLKSVAYDRKRQKELEEEKEEKEKENNQKGGNKSKNEDNENNQKGGSKSKKEVKKTTKKVAPSKRKRKSTDTPDLTEMDNEDSD